MEAVHETKKVADMHRSCSMAAIAVAGEEQDRLYEELPFVVLPGMRNRSTHRIRRWRVGRALSALQQESTLAASCDVATITEEEEYIEKKSPGFTLALARSSAIALLSMFTFGYNSSVINAAQQVAFPGKTIGQWSLAVAIFAIGGPVGAYAGGLAADQWGRRAALLANAALTIAAVLLMALAPGMALFTAGRLAAGVSSGISMVIIQLYLSELAPPNLRGSLGTCNQFATVVGILVSNLVGFPLAKSESWAWRVMLGIAAVPPALQLLTAPFLYESPRWYLMQMAKVAAGGETGGEKNKRKGAENSSRGFAEPREAYRQMESAHDAAVFGLGGVYAAMGTDPQQQKWRDRAVRVIEAVRGATAEEVEAEVARIMRATGLLYDAGVANQQAAADMEAGTAGSSGSGNGSGRSREMLYWEVLTDEKMRLPLLVALGLNLAQPLSGINAVMYYSNAFFESMHFANPLLGTTAVGAVNALATALAIPLMDRAGRRPLLLGGIAGMVAALAAITVALTAGAGVGWAEGLALFGINAYVFAFELGLGPIPLLIVAEMFPPQSGAKACALAGMLNWMGTFAVALLYPAMQQALGGLSLVPFAAVLAVAGLCAARYVAETKAKTQPQIQQDMAALWEGASTGASRSKPRYALSSGLGASYETDYGTSMAMATIPETSYQSI